MANVIINKDKLDILANAISNKSGEPVTMTLDEMVEAVDNIDTEVELQTKSVTYTATTSSQTDTITPSQGYDGIGEVDVTINAIPTMSGGGITMSDNFESTAIGNLRKFKVHGNFGLEESGWINDDYHTVSTKTYDAIPTNTSVTPTTSSQTIGGAKVMLEGAVTVNPIPSQYIIPSGTKTIDSAGTTDVTQYASASVPSASPFMGSSGETYVTESGMRKWKGNVFTEVNVSEGDTEGWLPDGYHQDYTFMKPAVPSNTSVTPTESSQTIGGADVMMEGAVTVNAIPSNYVGSGITRRDSTDLSASGATVSVPSGFYENNASKAVASGTEGTPTATKGTVTNHSVSITPSVTNTAGYISGGTHNGTAVSVSASELVSGNLAITENGSDIDVANYSTVSVNVSGGSSTVAVGTKTATLSASASSISFTGLSGNPTSFVVTSSADQSTGGTKAVAVAWDGTSFHGMDVTTQAEDDTGFTKSYSSGTLTITATTASFQANEYKLVYTYGGSSSDIHTADVQVGSGATSITFSSLSGRPIYFSCVFKSSFSTSSGYQRVIDVVNDGTNTYGHAFDSSAKAQTSWTSSYSGGSLTITSSGTNNGGYFHQPGYYQLTYAVDDSAPSYQTKSVYATTSAQTITADNGYDALEQVDLGAISQTNLTAGNIKSGTTISISNGSTNLWSVTGTYSGGGGGSASVATTTWTNNTNTVTSHEFTGLSGTPKAAFLRCTSSLSRSSSSTNYFIADIRWDGSTTGGVAGNSYRRSNGNYANVTSGYSVTTGSNSITFTSNGSSTANPGSFYNGTYELTYIY